MPSGTVKWFNEERGYGFIKHDNSGRDVFIHVKEVQKAGYSTVQCQKETHAPQRAASLFAVLPS